MANRMLGTAPVNVQIHFPPVMPFFYRPGTTDLLVLEQVFLDRDTTSNPFCRKHPIYSGPGQQHWCDRHVLGATLSRRANGAGRARPDNFKLLQRNTAAFQDRCVLLNVAVSDKRARPASFARSRIRPFDSQGEDSVSEILVKTLTVSDVLSEAEFPRVDLLKMDIEGGEQIVMPTNRRMGTCAALT